MFKTKEKRRIESFVSEEYLLNTGKLGNIVSEINKTGTEMFLIKGGIDIFGERVNDLGSKLQSSVARITDKPVLFEDENYSLFIPKLLYLQIYYFKGWEDSRLVPDLPEILKEYIMRKKIKN